MGRRSGRGQQKGKSPRIYVQVNALPSEALRAGTCSLSGGWISTLSPPQGGFGFYLCMYIYIYISMCEFLFPLAGLKIAESKIHLPSEPLGRQIKGTRHKAGL